VTAVDGAVVNRVVNWRGVLVAGGWFSAASGKIVANVAAWDGSAWWQLNELFTPSALLQLAAGESEVQPVSLDCGQQVSCTVDSGEIFDLYPQGNDLYFTQAISNLRRRSVGRGGPVINQGASLGVFRSSLGAFVSDVDDVVVEGGNFQHSLSPAVGFGNEASGDIHLWGFGDSVDGSLNDYTETTNSAIFDPQSWNVRYADFRTGVLGNLVGFWPQAGSS